MNPVTLIATRERSWEPLRDVIAPWLAAHLRPVTALAEKPLVVVKPNWIQEHCEPARGADDWQALITHPALVIAVVRTLLDHLPAGSRVVLCDAPNTYADFSATMRNGGLLAALEALRRSRPRISLSWVDLRREVWTVRGGVIVDRHPNTPDALGYTSINLGAESGFVGHRGEGRYYGADYDERLVNAHHHGIVHEYLLAGTPVSADLFINLPKLKTHKKTGLTCSLKNLVGINGDKNWLPHYTEGPPRRGGDEYPEVRWTGRLETAIKKPLRQWAARAPTLGTPVLRYARSVGMSVLGDSTTSIRNGNWSGNDTCWRMVLDLNRALLYGRPDGTLGTARRPYLTIVDALIGGEGDGPLSPAPVQSDCILMGDDPAASDAVACRLMGFEPERLPLVREAFAAHRLPISPLRMEEVTVFDSRVGREVGLRDVASALGRPFRPHFGWPDLSRA